MELLVQISRSYNHEFRNLQKRSINFKKSRCFRPKDLWRLVKPAIDKKSPCVLIADDTLIAKTRSRKIEMVHDQYSGHKHDVIAGIGLVHLLWHDLTSAESIPIDYRIYDKASDGKTKNTHFSEMLALAKKRGAMPEAVVMDAWYSSLDNLKSILSHGWVWVTTLRKNRIVNHNKPLNTLHISEEGTPIHLRGYGWVTVFKFTAKNGRIDYIVTNTKILTVNTSNLSWMHVGLLKFIIEKLNKIVVFNAVRLVRAERKAIIFFSLFLRSLNNTNVVYLKK